MVAAVMLNWGLFPVLLLLSPLVTGLIIGFLMQPIRISILINSVSALVAYLVLFVVTSSTYDPVAILSASLLMAAIGGLGGLTGGVLQKTLGATRYRH